MCSIHHRTKWYAAIVMAAASLPLAPAADGAVTYAFEQTTYQALPGATVSVPLYLKFDGNDLSLLTAGNGLTSAGAFITTLNAPGDPALLSDINGAPSQFDGSILVLDGFGNFMLPDPPAKFLPVSIGRLYFTAITTPYGVAATGSRVLLGNLEFKAGAAAGQTTTFNVGIVDTLWVASTAGDYAKSVEPVVFDPIGSATVSVTVVPEPGAALSLVVLATAGLLTRSWRRVRHQPTAQ